MKSPRAARIIIIIIIKKFRLVLKLPVLLLFYLNNSFAQISEQELN